MLISRGVVAGQPGGAGRGGDDGKGCSCLEGVLLSVISNVVRVVMNQADLRRLQQNRTWTKKL